MTTQELTVKSQDTSDLKVVDKVIRIMQYLVKTAQERRRLNPESQLTQNEARLFIRCEGTLLAIVGYDEYNRIMNIVNPLPF